MSGAFNLKAVEVALYKAIESVDADLAFQLEQPEDGDPSKYPDLARLFAEAYREVMSGPRESERMCVCGDPYSDHSARGYNPCVKTGCDCFHFVRSQL